jgi:hypothetical protein
VTGGDDQRRPVSVARVFEYAVEQIVAVAGELWPGEPVQLGEHVPSVTSYVHRISVGGRPLYAKYSVLGTSLVSVLRGAHGDWPAVLTAQRGYVRQRDGLLAREAEQLRLLVHGGQLDVCPVAGYRNGVLFTEVVTSGVALDELLLGEPHRTPDVLRRVWAPLTRLYRTPVEGWPVIAERDIVATFTRKFLGGQGSTVHFGAHLRRDVGPDVVEGLRYVVRRLRTIPATRPTTTLVFGEVKPEHILMTGTGPVFLDPGVHVAAPVSDLAKLVSRLLLMVMARVSATSARRHIVAGLTDMIWEERSTAGLASSTAWMVELLTLVARDTVNIVSTYLTTPERFPLPRSAGAVLERAGLVVPVVEHLVTGLAQRMEPVEIWARLSAEVVGS